MKSLLVALFLLMNSALGSQLCGKEGTVEERIKDCNATKGGFALVHRNEKGIEIYKDTKSGLVWGDRINTDFNHYGSNKACDDVDVLKDFKWRLPTLQEFKDASSHGMKSNLPHMNHWFWTSTPVQSQRKGRRRRINPSQAYVWDGTQEISEAGDIKDAASVRCVVRL